MRIIAGDYKGRKIFEPTDKETRPLKDLTKDSIFNIIQHSKNIKISTKSFFNNGKIVWHSGSPILTLYSIK